MVFKNKLLNKFWRFSCSFQLGIPILVTIGVLVAWGTIVESRYDAVTAKMQVYDSWFMFVTMSLLIYNLVAVVVDRWPWQLRHYPFIVVHAGIIILIFGGFVTSNYGLDGQMVVRIGGKNDSATISKTDLVVYATFDGDRYTKITDREVDFFNHPPTPEKPYIVEMGTDQIKIFEYIKYAFLDMKVRKTDDVSAGSSIRFQLMNSNVKTVEQITQSKKDRPATFNLGPAKVILGPLPAGGAPANEIYITPLDNESVTYTIMHRSSVKPFKTGKLKIGEVVATGWMGLEFRLLDFLPSAREEYDVIKKERPSELTTAAIQIEHKGMKRWVALNDLVKLFGDSSAFLFSYQNRRIPLGFDLHLNNFEVTRYKGTSKAMEYASQVEVVKGEERNQAVISMNEPMKYRGFTIYQASFQEDPATREPTASVFSINQDPGRVTKYFGSLILSIGIVWLFYQRRKKATAI